MSELLVIENEEGEDLGGFERGFRNAGLSWRVVRAHAGEPVPASMLGAPGLVVLGGSPHVYEPTSAPWMDDVQKLIRHAHSGRVPVLGICLGAQLVAHALGGRAIRGPSPEVGFSKITLAEAAKADPHAPPPAGQGALPSAPRVVGGPDPVVGHLDGVKVFHMHEDSYIRPPGAALLASSQQYEEQAFRVGATTYGLQFHPEATPDLVARMVPEEMDAEKLVREAKAFGPDLDRAADGVAMGFAGLVARKLRL